MPWKSKKQEAWGNSDSGKKAMGEKSVQEFNQASKGKKMPERAPMQKGKPLIDMSGMMKK